MKIISRAGWGARKPRSRTAVEADARRWFVIHHSGGPVTQTVRAIQDWCMNEPPHGRGFSDIDYNFLVRGSTGEIYEGRGWDVVGSHTVGYNTTGIGVCVIGNNEPLSDAAKDALLWLHAEGERRAGRNLTVRGHGQLTATGCPGSRILDWIGQGLPAPPREDIVDQKDIDKIVKAVVAELRPGIDAAASAWDDAFGKGDNRVSAGAVLVEARDNTRAIILQLQPIAETPPDAPNL